MSIKQYNRGTLVNRRLIDAQVAGINIDRSARENREDVLRERLATAEHDLAKARRLIRLLRAERQFARLEMAEVREDHTVTRKIGKRLIHRLAVITEKWRKCSAMLRLLTPEQVQQLREGVEPQTN